MISEYTIMLCPYQLPYNYFSRIPVCLCCYIMFMPELFFHSHLVFSSDHRRWEVRKA